LPLAGELCLPEPCYRLFLAPRLEKVGKITPMAMEKPAVKTVTHKNSISPCIFDPPFRLRKIYH